MTEPDLIYKVTILNLLAHSDSPLSDIQITDFLLENGYTDYFTVKKNLGELLEKDLISETDTDDGKRFSISDSGRETLTLLSDRITPGIDRDTRDFLRDRKIQIREGQTISSNYDASPGGGYEVRLKVFDADRMVIDLGLHVASKDQAEAMCMNWEKKCDEVYDYLMENIF